MALGIEAVAAVMADRLAELTRGCDTVLLAAPREFAPDALATAVAERLFPRTRVVRIEVGSPGWEEALAADTGGRPQLVVADGDAAGVGERMLRALEARERSGPPVPLCLAWASDLPCDELASHVDRTLGPDALALRTGEVVALLAAEGERDPGVLARVVDGTGGIPALIAEYRVADRDDRGCRAVAAAWVARRPGPVDPLMVLQAHLGRVRQEAVVLLAGAVLGEGPWEERVAAQRRQCCFTRFGDWEPGIPRLVSQELIERGRLEGVVPGMRRRLARAVASAPLHPVEQWRILTSLGDWATLDRSFASTLHQLPLIGVPERRYLSQLWPSDAPHWPHLAAARTWATGARPDGAIGLPDPWQEAQFLVAAEVAPPEGGFLAEATQWLRYAEGKGRSVEAGPARYELTQGIDWLRGHAERLLATGAGDGGDAVVVCLGLLGAADSSVSVGAVVEAQRCVQKALDLCEVHHLGRWNGGLVQAALARAALLAAEAGAVQVASAHQRAFARACKGWSAADEHERLVAISRRFKRAGLGETGEPGVLDVDPGLPMANLAAEAEALRALLLRGPEQGGQWLRGMVARSLWARWMPWEWWPLDALIALLEARERRPGEAQSWVDKGAIPAQYGDVVRSAVAFAAGDLTESGAAADRVLAMPDAPARWRALACGLKVAVLDGLGATVERDRLLGSMDWARAVGVVALLPDAARALVLPTLPGEVASLPGLVVGRPARPCDARLTPRQLDILRGLGRGATMREIAEEFGLGVETVRTTAKQLYRRMGVHGRDEAVAQATAQGLL